MNDKCLLCGNFLEYELNLAWIFSFNRLVEQFICSECRSCFEKIQGNICLGCGRPTVQKICLDCQKWQKKGRNLLQNKALYRYQNQRLKEYFERYKFMGDYRLRKVFQKEFEQFILQTYPPKNWVYIPIPIDEYTQNKTRLFNQVIGLVEDLPLVNAIKMYNDPDRVKQSHKDRKERLKSKQYFKLVSSCELTNKNLVLIDDIYTTGATLYHAQKILLSRKPAKIRSITLAR